MKELLRLHIPAYEELWYRQKIMQDPNTMSYNKGYDLSIHGYDTLTGCIAFPEKEWSKWYAAVQTHLSAGFTKYKQENGILKLLMTKEQYARQKAIAGGIL